LFIGIDVAVENGETSETGTDSTGNSLSALFVFEQTLTVDVGARLDEHTTGANDAEIGTGTTGPVTTGGIAGSLSLNNVAGVGNQQGNNLSTAAEIGAGANAVENDGRQTLVDNGDIGEGHQVDNNFAYVGTLAGVNGISGAVAINNAAGVGNQQGNNITLAH
jgi:hypothetical protein